MISVKKQVQDKIWVWVGFKINDQAQDMTRGQTRLHVMSQVMSQVKSQVMSQGRVKIRGQVYYEIS